MMREEEPLKAFDYVQHGILKKKIKEVEKELNALTGKTSIREFFIEVSDEDIDLLKAYIFFTFAPDTVLNYKRVSSRLKCLDQKQP